MSTVKETVLACTSKPVYLKTPIEKILENFDPRKFGSYRLDYRHPKLSKLVTLNQLLIPFEHNRYLWARVTITICRPLKV